jgi:chromosome partitioning protein
MWTRGGRKMHIVAIVSQKGGAGKTTLSVHLAVAAARKGMSVALIDLDPQATAAQWGDWRGGDNPAVVATPYTRLEATLLEAAQAGVEIGRAHV